MKKEVNSHDNANESMKLEKWQDFLSVRADTESVRPIW